MQAFDTDSQAAQRRRILGVGKRSTVGTSAAHVSSGLKVFLRLTVEQSGTARRFNGYQSLRYYIISTYLFRTALEEGN